MINNKAKDLQTQKVTLYRSEDGDVNIDAVIKDDTLWLTQKSMSELYGVQVPAISKHLKNIFEEDELDPDVVISKMEITTQHGAIVGKSQNKKAAFYNLDAIISVGYRVNSRRAAAFRIWATNLLREYMIKGFVMDDRRLEQGEVIFGRDYFRELLERVRSIRTSERRIWLQLTDIFAECSIDYNKASHTARHFYAEVQNKFHFAITGKTAAEIIYSNADTTKEHVGLKTWKNSPDGRILQSDVTVAKNYLSEKEIRSLERSVSGFFDYIEGQIERGNAFTMEDFAKSIDKFLTFQDYKILQSHGSITKMIADAKAKSEYVKFNKIQKINSDFEQSIRRNLEKTDNEDIAT